MVLDAHNLKDKELYEGHKYYLHIVLKCLIQKGGVVEPMGSAMEIKRDKRIGLTFEEIRE